MALAALIVSILALLVAAGSLAWQTRMFHLSGGRVKVDTLAGLLLHEGGRLLTSPAPKPDEDARHNIDEALFVPMVVLRVRNIGRLPVTVRRLLLEFEEVDIAYEPAPQDLKGEPIPYRLESGESQDWAITQADAETTAGMFSSDSVLTGGPSLEPGAFVKLRACAELGDGRDYSSKAVFHLRLPS